MASPSLPTIVTSGRDPLVTSFPQRPPPPPPPPIDDDIDEGDDHDDDGSHESISGKDSGDDNHYSTKPPQPSSSSTQSASQSSTTLITSAESSQTTFSSSVILTPTANSSSKSMTSASAQVPASTTSAFDLSHPDSTPVNQGDPSLQANTNHGGLGTAGIVLAAVFGFVALISVFYLLFRLVRHRKAYRQQSSPNHANMSSTFNNQSSIEKGRIIADTRWTSSKQETGIIFGRLSGMNSRSAQADEHHRSHFSFFSRYRSSTGTGATTRDNLTLSSPTATHTTHNTASIFNLNQPYPHSLSTSTNSTNHLNDQYTQPNSNDVNRTSSHRSNGSTGSGHARAYAHHNVRAPRSVARSTISSISSRWLKRRSDPDNTTSHNRGSTTSEISDLYGADSPIHRTRSITSESSRCEHSPGTVPPARSTPRLPLPIATGETWSIRLSA